MASMSDSTTLESIGELVRKAETAYLQGNTQISKHVNFDMHGTLEKIDAYLNSKHITGQFDTLNRKKPFFNIGIAAANIWYRATDIDRSQIKIRATKSKDWLDSFLATIHVQDWMRREKFGQFLNEWGRVLSRYGSAVIKFVRNKSGLHIFIVPWNKIICDVIDFDNNLKIEVLELTPAQLRKRVVTMGYDKVQVDALIAADQTTREDLDKRKKDNKQGYIKIYEAHGELPWSTNTRLAQDDAIYAQQMFVFSYTESKKDRRSDPEFQDFILYKGKEEKDPYMITHLLKTEGRTLSIGAIESLFEAQWMVNHSQKAIKDVLDLASRIFFQTADSTFVGTNVIQNLQVGDVFVNNGKPLSQVEMSAHDLSGWTTYAVQWKQLGNEITGVSESMLGNAPKSGTAWRLFESQLQESYSLFEVFAENKGLYLEEFMREWVLPYIKETKLNTADEIMATLEANDLDKIDSIYIKNKAIETYNNRNAEMVLNDLPATPYDPAMEQAAIKETLSPLGNKRSFKPTVVDKDGKEVAVKWVDQFKDLEWELEIDVTGEERDVKSALTTLNTTLQMMLTPGFEQNKKAQAVAGKILELTKVMSPLEYYALPSSPVMSPASPDGSMGGGATLPNNQPMR